MQKSEVFSYLTTTSEISYSKCEIGNLFGNISTSSITLLRLVRTGLPLCRCRCVNVK